MNIDCCILNRPFKPITFTQHRMLTLLVPLSNATTGLAITIASLFANNSTTLTF